MSDDVMPYAGLPLRGEKVSIGSPSPVSASQSLYAATAASREFFRATTPVVGQAASTLRPAVSLCGTLALWIAPALLLSRYTPEQLFDALVRVSLKPTGSALLTLLLALAYVVLTGLLLGRATVIPRAKAARVLIPLAVAPLVMLSLIVAFIGVVPLCFGALVMCFPNLV